MSSKVSSKASAGSAMSSRLHCSAREAVSVVEVGVEFIVWLLDEDVDWRWLRGVEVVVVAVAWRCVFLLVRTKVLLARGAF